MTGKYTHICVILDRSGSMEGIRDDTIGGFNVFLEEQIAAPAAATLTLIQFDSSDPFEVVHDFTPVQSVPKLTRDTFVPRSGTPLLDCIGRALNATEERIGKMAEFCRPDKVIIAIVTDGQENSSREFRKQDLAAMIKSKQQAGWEIRYLSADLDAIEEAVEIGIPRSQTLHYDRNPDSTRQAWQTLSWDTSELRARGSDAPSPGEKSSGSESTRKSDS